MTTDDTRVRCADCNNLQRGHCIAPRQAGLRAHYGKAEIGPTLAALLQRCAGFVSSARVRSGAIRRPAQEATA